MLCMFMYVNVVCFIHVFVYYCLMHLYVRAYVSFKFVVMCLFMYTYVSFVQCYIVHCAYLVLHVFVCVVCVLSVYIVVMYVM